MANTCLFDKVAELKEKFATFFQHRKKLKALENYSSAIPFQHRKYLYLIKNCMEDGFLHQEEAQFLDHMLKKYEVNYLDWAHKTKWLKEQIATLTKAEPEPIKQYVMFNEPAAPKYNVPLEILNKQINKQKQLVGR